MASKLGVALRSSQRFFSSQAGASSHGGHDPNSYKVWRNSFFLLGLPALGLVWYNAYYVMPQHPERDEFIAYKHLRLRNKPFPWGDGNKSLFHNSYYNALPEGYEEGSEELHPAHGHH